MELCANRSLSNLQPVPYHRLLPTAVNRRFRPSFHLKQTISSLRTNSGDVSRKHSCPRSIMSEETPSEMSKFDGESSSSKVAVEDVPPSEKNTFNNSLLDESSSDEGMQPFGEILDKLNLKLDTEDSYSLLLYGGGALISVWLLSAVVGAIDSIPLFPKFLEVVGLSYSLWFTTRYLLFKENRDELASKIEELKKQVIGSDED